MIAATKTYKDTTDMALQEGKRQGIILAIDTLRDKKFQEMFDLDHLESEICAEALFTYINELLK